MDNKYKWSVGISSVNFHGKFALKFELREFYESLHPSGGNSQFPLDTILANV